MRTIKFRVWDKEENKFFTPIYEAYKGKLLDLSIGLSGDIMRRTLELPAEHESCFPNRYELQQFTGLQDKNGVDIYEGDILQTQIGKLDLVVFMENGFYGKSKYDKNRIISNPLCSDYLTNKEVIGNIHENPELL